MENEHRTDKFKKSRSLEETLKRLEALLSPIELSSRPQVSEVFKPVIYIMGCARSGTTLLYQCLAATGHFAFPTNFLSRFYYAPWIGSLVQKALIEFDYNNEIFEGASEDNYQSELGKTKGPLAPHEFWYYWRQFFPMEGAQKLNPSPFIEAQGKQFIDGLKSIAAINDKPLLLKGMYLNWNIKFLNDLHSPSYFVYIERDPVDNAISLLNTRKRFFGSEEKWYSFFPPGYEKVLRLSPSHQVLWQVKSTNKAIVEQLDAMKDAGGYTCSVAYEKLCEEPHGTINDLLHQFELPASDAKLFPDRFDKKRETDNEQPNWERIEEEITPYL